ncbi:linear gramicidin synthetase subunit B domain protein [Mycobacterium xenopi 4042]|uniref:Linear gramicidin synthetase subunit B domain protein n=1 Tax=Mycobacterium xenopi 4042 TaxID=1299334 RepID=X8AMW9_MYCXE|nr:linear gramicidin synthetase subunit B domain protein [Mycobacterium xenopi 4042]
MWRISAEGLSLTGAAAAIRVPLPHTLELNAGTVDSDAGRSCTPTGPGRRRRWTTPRSAG